MGITEFIAQYVTAFIDKTGYISVFVLMVMESMVLPIPSEAVMPFAGFLIADSKLTFTLVIAVSTLGSIVGSILSYGIGLYGGQPFIERYGRFFLLDRDALAATERFFKKYGNATIFICRFIPVVRHLISLPAGIGRMNLVRFSIYTIIGAGLWNAFLTVCGFYLRKNWEVVMQYIRIVDIAVLAVLVFGIAFFIKKHVSRRWSAG